MAPPFVRGFVFVFVSAQASANKAPAGEARATTAAPPRPPASYLLAGALGFAAATAAARMSSLPTSANTFTTSATGIASA
jgi:hypothetical protein